MRRWFDRLVQRTTAIVGSPLTFGIILAVTLLWLSAGPYYRFNSDWNFLANTSTTVVTTILVILLQASQNRESKAIQLKLDEIVRAIDAADNRVMLAEDLPDCELDAWIARYKATRHHRSPPGAPGGHAAGEWVHCYTTQSPGVG
jgi:low affinity Fe/Cu permease